MPVPLSEISLFAVRCVREEYIVETIPAITLGSDAVVVMATAAVVIKNPTVSRRGIFSWFGRG